MAHPTLAFDRFLRRVHRRFVLLRLIERTALGVLISCAAALPLLSVALWRNLPTLPLACCTLFIGAIAGFLWGLLTRPTLLAAAMEADQQLQWADLLSGALAVEPRFARDPWAASVLAAADAKCRGTSPAAVILNHLGARAWGGIGLATALVIVLGLLPTYAIPTRASDAGSTQTSTAPLSEPLALQGQLFSAPPVRSGPPLQYPQDLHPNKMIGAEAPAPAQASTAAGQPKHDEESTNSASQGAGASHSPNSPQSPHETIAGATHARSGSSIGQGAGGAGQSTADQGTGQVSGLGAGAASTASRPPPWQAAGWPTDARRALHAVDTGDVPDAYRPLIRGYFEQP